MPRTPAATSSPAAGLLTEVVFPPPGKDLRIDTWVGAGTEIPPYFDPMIAKVIVHAASRDQAHRGAARGTGATRCTARDQPRYLRADLADAPFAAGRDDPLPRRPSPISGTASTCSAPGTQTTVQDWPGRIGYWDVGVPPSGPMDERALRLGNRLLGNPQDAAGLEITMTGPTLRFNIDA
jgi:urea carboxylase